MPAEEITTNAATGIRTNKATLNGTLVWGLMLGGRAYCNFQWGKTTDYDYQTDAQLKSPGESFSAQITELKPNTLYHFRAKTGYETAYGEDKTFRTRGGGGILLFEEKKRRSRVGLQI